MTQTLTAEAIRVQTEARFDAEAARTGIPRSYWGSPIELETKRRITIAVAAYAYEIKDTPIMGDRTFDMIAQSINPKMGTCHPLLDEFFVVHFSPMTGMWIHHHPELPKIAALYRSYYSGVIRDHFESLIRQGKPIP